MVGIIITLLVIILIVFLLVSFWNKFKKLKISNVTLISGGVKTGKSWLSVRLAISKYRINTLLWYLKWPFLKLKEFIQRKRKDGYKVPLRPVLYSNIPLRYVKFSLITDYKLFFRECKLPLDSVVLLDEVSLIADSLMIYSYKFNEMLKNFIKLFAHQNGNNAYLIMNTQSLDDCHFNFKRCIGTYLYIYRTIKFPFISCMKVREMLSINGESVNVSDKDFEDSCLIYLIGNRYHKFYDSRCYSTLTDKFDYIKTAIEKRGNKDDLKCNDILSLHHKYIEMLNDERAQRKHNKRYDRANYLNEGELL